LTHVSEVVALGYFVEVDCFADCAGTADADSQPILAGSATADRRIE
jgi:hypothetical protein